MTKVVYNACYGGFNLSYKALEIIYAAKGKNLFYYKSVNPKDWNCKKFAYVENPTESKGRYTVFDEYMGDSYDEVTMTEEERRFHDEHYVSPYIVIARHDPVLVAAVETLGREASGSCADLRIAEVSGNKYRIEDYDGYETVYEPDDYEWIEG